MILTKLNGNQLKNYLKDIHLEENLQSYLRILLGNLCRISYEYIDGENNTSIIEEIIDILIQGLDHDKLLSSSIYALRYISQYMKRII